MIQKIILGISLVSMTQLIPAKAFADAPAPNRDSSIFYFNMGKEEQASRKYANAWKFFEKATQFDPANSEAYMGVADVCFKMNRTAPAVKALEDLVRLNPNDKGAQWRLIQLNFDYGQWSKVIETMPKAHQLNPEIKGWAYMLGKSYYATQNYGKGIEYMQVALKEEPKNADAYYLIGKMYNVQSNFKNAIPFYQKALALDSVTANDFRTYEFAGLLANAEDFNESIKWFQKALDKGYKARDDFYNNFANTLADAHQTDRAIAMMQEMLTRRPQDMELISSLADICYHSKKYKQAMGYWDQILGYDEHNAQAIYHIGLCYIKMGNKADGQTLCDRAIIMDPAIGVLRKELKM